MGTNSKSATIKDIAKKANTSHATVSRVFNNSGYPVSKEARQRVLNAAKELNYTPNLIGRYLKNKKTTDIGVMVPNISNPYFSCFVQCIEEIMGNNGYNVLLSSSYRNSEKEEQILENFVMKQVSGIIIFPISKSYKVLNLIKKRDIKVVSIDQDLGSFPCSKVLLDCIKIGLMATEYLIKLGHERIAFISSPLDRTSRKDIFEGYNQALQNYNIPYDDKLVQISEQEKEYPNEVYEFNNGYNLMKIILDNKNMPTGVFACNDLTAMGVMEAIKEAGLRIPEDISVIGCDNIFMSSIINPKLTTINVPLLEMSRLAGNILLDKLNNKNDSDTNNDNSNNTNVVLQPSLIIRESCTKINKGKR